MWSPISARSPMGAVPTSRSTRQDVPRCGSRRWPPWVAEAAWYSLVVALLFAAASPAAAFDAEETFKKGTFVLSGEGAYGWQFDVEQKTRVTYLEYYDVGVRFSLLPLEPLGRDHFWYGSLEMGFEPL